MLFRSVGVRRPGARAVHEVVAGRRLQAEALGQGGQEDLDETAVLLHVGDLRSPSSHRTPIFPQFSQDPIYRRRRGIMLFVLVLVVTAIVVSVSWWWAEGRFTTTPEVINIPQEQALQALKANGLEYTTQEAFSEDVAVDSVKIGRAHV